MGRPRGAVVRPLQPIASAGLVNALASPTEIGTVKTTVELPASPAWTSTFKESRKPRTFDLIDQIWLSPALASKLTGAYIGRRRKLSRDGTDHDPASPTYSENGADADSEVVATVPPRTRSVLVETVGLRPGVTPGVWLGRWLGVLFPLAAAGGLALRAVAYRREQRPESAPAPQAPTMVGAPDEKAFRD
jgi:hypothetical protein